ncbi:MAG: hypothetical protein ACI9SP_004241 [Arenicella sp.]|jgi:hypothetical protein
MKVSDLKDRRYKLFGREPDVKHLSGCALESGVTAILARPKMGKTWTLNEVARRLDSERHLVGYYQAGGAENNIILYVLLDAYTRWLTTSSSYRQQAEVVFKQNKGSYSSGLTNVFAPLFENLNLPGVSGIGKLISEAFSSLGKLNEDLKDGGLRVPKLDHNRVKELALLLFEITQKPLVLILDAWEKSNTSFSSEYNLLDRFLDNTAEWPPCHFYLGIRKPEVDETNQLANAIYRCMQDWSKRDRFTSYELPLMHLDQAEKERLVTYINHTIPGSRNIESNLLLDMIDCYPSVLERWENQATRPSKFDDQGQYQELADEANDYRYRELPVLIRELGTEQRKFAIRVTLFPRLNNELWSLFQDTILGECDAALIDELTQQFLFEKEAFPFYGHDTRHSATNKLLLNDYHHAYKQQAERLIWDLASKIENFSTPAFIQPLLMLGHWATSLDTSIVNRPTKFVLDCTDSLLKEDGLLVFETDVLKNPELKQVAPLVAQALYDRGITKGTLNDTDGEIDDYTRVINMQHAPSELVAKALVNRGLRKSTLNDTDGEIDDCTTVINMGDAPSEQIAKALFNRGVRKGTLNDTDGEIDDYTTAVNMEDAPSELVAKALVNRGFSKGMLNDTNGAIDDYTTVINMADAPSEQVAKALYNRGFRKGTLNDTDGEIDDYTTAVNMKDAPSELVALALLFRGIRKGMLNDTDGAIADYTAAINIEGAPSEVIALAKERISLLRPSD